MATGRESERMTVNADRRTKSEGSSMCFLRGGMWQWMLADERWTQ